MFDLILKVINHFILLRRNLKHEKNFSVLFVSSGHLPPSKSNFLTTCLKWTYKHSGNDYRVATLSKSSLTTTEITMQSLKSMEQF